MTCGLSSARAGSNLQVILTECRDLGIGRDLCARRGRHERDYSFLLISALVLTIIAAGFLLGL